MIQSIEDLNKAISLATRRGNVLVTGYVEMLTFAFSQATEHKNSNSFTLIRGAITQFAARPVECLASAWTDSFGIFVGSYMILILRLTSLTVL